MTDRVTTEQVIQRLNEIGDHELAGVVAEMQAAFRRCADDKLRVLEERDRLAAERDEQRDVMDMAIKAIVRSNSPLLAAKLLCDAVGGDSSLLPDRTGWQARAEKAEAELAEAKDELRYRTKVCPDMADHVVAALKSAGVYVSGTEMPLCVMVDDAMQMLCESRADNARLSAIVEQLPRYEDTGEPIMEGDEVYSVVRGGVGLSWWQCGDTDECPDPSGENGFQLQTGKGYFKHRQAAEAAAKGDSDV